MTIKRQYLHAAYTASLGVLTCIGWLSIGQADDAPGAGLIGFAALFSSLVVAFTIARASPAS